jgi:hypothetical protein
MPRVIVKKRKMKEATEGLERSRRLAKQVLALLVELSREALRLFGVRALVFGPTPISQSSLVAGVTESIAGSPSSPTEGLKIGRVSR